MKIFRKTVSFILCFVLIAALLPTPEFSAASKKLIKGVYYSTETYYTAGNVRHDIAVVVDCQNGYDVVTVQPTYNGLPVTKIKSSAFANLPGLKRVNLPDTITEIGDGAFNDCGITNIDIPDSVTKIGISAFMGCKSLESIDIPESVTELTSEGSSGSIFAGCTSLRSATIPGSIEYLPSTTFYGCTALESVVLGEGIKNIGYNAFDGCSSLAGITLPQSVETIGDGVFMNCTSLSEITVPENVTSIGDEAFRDCTSLSEIIISEGVTSIGDKAFDGCSELKSITLPESLESMGIHVFGSATENIHIPDLAKWCSVSHGGGITYYNCYYGLYLNGKNLTGFVIPDGVTSVGDYAFVRSKITAVKIPDSVTSIGKSAFYDCKDLKIIIIPESVTEIGNAAFEGSSVAIWTQRGSFAAEYAKQNRKTVCYFSGSVPEDPTVWFATEDSVRLEYVAGCEYSIDGVNWQDDTLFEGLAPSTEYHFRQRIKAIGDLPASGASDILTVKTSEHSHYYNTWVAEGDYHYKACRCGDRTEDKELHYGGTANCSSPKICSACQTAYGEKDPTVHQNTGLRNYEEMTCEKDGYTGDVYCLDCGALVSYGETVKSAGHDYKTEVIPATKEARGYTLHTCEVCGDSYKDEYTDITDVYYKTVGDHAVVTDCNGSMSDIVIKSEYEGLPVTEIEDLAFENKTNLKSITVPDSIVKIGKSAFKGCENLERVYIFDLAKWCGISFIDKDSNPLLYAGGLYLNGEKIVDLIIPDGVEKIGDFAFVGATVSTVTIPSGVKHIGNGAFMHCIYIIIIRLPDSIITIGKDAFAYCPVLTDVRLPEHLDKIEDGLFAGCTGLTDIKIPDGVMIIGDGAFSDCTGLTEIFLPDSVTTIGDNAFWGCIDIILIVIPGNIRYIGDSAFDGCDRLIAEVSAGSNAEDLLRTAGVPYSVHSGGEATCVSAAVCARCGTQYEEKNPENHKHTELRNYVPSTCRSEGYSGDIYCFDCETLQLGKVTEKSAHVYRTEKVRPTKEAQGYTLHTCVHCDHTYKDDYIDFLYGDINGDGKVNNLDRLLLSRWLAKWKTALDEGISGDAADVNGDGKVNNLDRLVLARHLARWAGYETLG